jgi:hypothetical protein
LTVIGVAPAQNCALFEAVVEIPLMFLAAVLKAHTLLAHRAESLDEIAERLDEAADSIAEVGHLELAAGAPLLRESTDVPASESRHARARW